ncbi:hypothetical protein SEA_FORZA_21 [Gordonia phage Forza]|uniref:Uncharacterized protein n=1 Tax=Gordonia phage Forza TaxID=2571247 RepID=A0A650EY81_9CAUD|nr:hypothetical protein PP303_gp021 [Gordonia phage Forza]QEM41490.1 hypothetical protein SEA_BOOPY_21 [Gordonia phage Boopy]QGT55014.1 hypothetical protein SEA_FORZA_21 [Gordonia phage Forza]UXE04163.1 hypothetical protein SEA_BLUENGOLD_19 [Gordonia phage BlueNGold]WBF03802.1 hypothetical protein SEA_MAREELIH_19 [Gordonia phage Mareelih]
MNENPEDHVLDAINELVDEQLQQEASGYDHNLNQPKCPNCHDAWHGLPRLGCDGALAKTKNKPGVSAPPGRVVATVRETSPEGRRAPMVTVVELLNEHLARMLNIPVGSLIRITTRYDNPLSVMPNFYVQPVRSDLTVQQPVDMRTLEDSDLAVSYQRWFLEQ